MKTFVIGFVILLGLLLFSSWKEQKSLEPLRKSCAGYAKHIPVDRLPANCLQFYR